MEDTRHASFVSVPNYLSLPRNPQRWLIKDLIPTSGLVNVFGAPKSGKTMAVLAMAAAIADGRSHWLSPEFKVMQAGKVAYVQVDTPREEMAERLEKLRRAGYNLENFFVCDQLMVKRYPMNILDQDEMLSLQKALVELQPVVTIIDTLRDVHGGDENDATVMRNVVSNLVAACRPSAMILLSHSRKTTDYERAGGDDLLGQNRGSSYVSGRMDMIIRVSANKEHTTALTFQGRSKNKGRITVSQDEDGWIILDGESAKYEELIRRRVQELREADPKISVNAMSKQIGAETGFKKSRAITTDINRVLVELEAERTEQTSAPPAATLAA